MQGSAARPRRPTWWRTGKLLSDEMDYIGRRLRLFEGPEGIALELVQWVEAAEVLRVLRTSRAEADAACS